MRKIPTVFRRDPENMARVLPEITPGCEWVFAGEGVPTRKFDGTCVMLDGSGEWWARREVKPGKQPPANFQPVEMDETTGRTVGWEPIAQSPFVKFWREVIDRGEPRGVLHELMGTYELCGPKINGNPEEFRIHDLIRHGDYSLHLTPPEPIDDVGLEFRTLRDWLLVMSYEGIVWHHPDGRMAKLKRRDFTSVKGRDTEENT